MANTSTRTSPSVDLLPMVDTHHHLWDLDRFRYDWLTGSGVDDVTADLGEYASIRVSYLVDELIADYGAVGVIKSVHVQADMSEADSVVESAWLDDIAKGRGFPQAIVAYADLRDPDVAHTLDRHCASEGMRGIRMPDRDGLGNDGAFGRGTTALMERGLSLQLDTPPSRIAEFLLEVAKSRPSLRIFLGHTGLPEGRDRAAFDEWRKAIRLAAEAENVVIKISGLGMGDHHWTTESIRPWVVEAIEGFGVDRCVFGTNWPVDRLYSDLPTLTQAYRQIISRFSKAEQEALLFRNAERLYAI